MPLSMKAGVRTAGDEMSMSETDVDTSGASKRRGVTVSSHGGLGCFGRPRMKCITTLATKYPGKDTSQKPVRWANRMLYMRKRS
jgi:hypothetical protein